MRSSILVAAVAASISLSLAADVQASVKKQTNIPAQGLGPALQAFAKDRNLQIIYVSEEVVGLRTLGVAGEVTPAEALEQLLQGTDLDYRYLDERTVTVFPVYAATENSRSAAQQKQNFDIPAQAAPAAIQRWAQQSGLQVLAAEADLRGIRTNPVQGIHMPVAAAQLLVAGTGLEVIASAERTITIRRARPATQAGGSGDEKFSSVQGEALMEILVTGSRIRAPGMDALQATIVTDSSEIERRAFTNIAQALDETPGFMRSGTNPLGTNQDTQSIGQSFVNLFGLGSQRTLTLVNGRRFVSSNSPASGAPGGSQVDLNVIPAGLVERVETVAIGGTPVYGSDAIAGTVNVILKDDFEGIQATALYGISDEDDARTESYRLLMGGNFAEGRGNAVFSVEYNEQAGLLLIDRFTRRFPITNPLNTSDTDGIPEFTTIRDARLGTMTEGGVPINPILPLAGIVFPGLFPNGNWVFDAAGNPLRFGSNGELVPYNTGHAAVDGAAFGAPGVPLVTDGGDGVSAARHQPLLAPTERTLINGIAHFDVAPSVRVFAEVAFAHTEGVEQSELSASTDPVSGGQPMVLSVDNPFLSAQARDILIANGLTEFQLNRNLGDIVDRTPATTQVDLYRIVAGLEGDFVAFSGETWSWDIAYNYGRSRNESTLTLVNADRLLEAVDAVVDPITGAIVCASGNTACRPLNLFGENNFSGAAADYVTDISRGTSINTLQTVTANLSGRLPFGLSDPIAFNIGAETRKEAASFTPDFLQQHGTFLSGNPLGFEGVEGEFKTEEIYGELIVPVFSPEQNLPVVKSLSVEGAVRYVDHSLNGGATTWSAGARFEPRLPGWGNGLMFRGVFTHAIRSPAVAELFTGTTSSVVQISDICGAQSFDEGLVPEIRAANCRAALAAVGAGAPETFDETTDVSGVSGTVSGNPDLDNEEADSWSVGIVYQPVNLPQLRLAADWANIRLEGGIESLTLGTLMQACYDSPDFPNLPACNTFRRLTAAEAAAQPGPARVAGDLANGFRSGFINTSKIEFAGLIVAAGYGFDLPGTAGSLRFGTRWFYTDEFRGSTFAGVVSDNEAGLTSLPRNRFNFDVGYTWGQLDVGLQARWTQSVLLDRVSTIEDTDFNKLPSNTLLDGSVGYRFSDNVSLQLSVTNLLNKEVPERALAASSLSLFDWIGRRYFAAVSANF